MNSRRSRKLRNKKMCNIHSGRKHLRAYIVSGNLLSQFQSFSIGTPHNSCGNIIIVPISQPMLPELKCCVFGTQLRRAELIPTPFLSTIHQKRQFPSLAVPSLSLRSSISFSFPRFFWCSGFASHPSLLKILSYYYILVHIPIICKTYMPNIYPCYVLNIYPIHTHTPSIHTQYVSSINIFYTPWLHKRMIKTRSSLFLYKYPHPTMI